MSDKVLITYKRKRFSSKSNSAKAVKVDPSPNTQGEVSPKCLRPKAELDTHNENLNEDSVKPDVGKDAVAKLAPSNGFAQVKGDADMFEDSRPPCFHRKSMGLPTNDIVKDSITVHQNKQPDLTKIKAPITEEPGDKLIEKRSYLRDSELATGLVSSTWITNTKSSKRAMYVIHENLVTSQSPTENCALALPGGDSEGKAKDFIWLENLDKALQETKEERSSSSRMEKVYIDHSQASKGMGLSLYPANSSLQSRVNQDVRRECKNEIHRAKEKLLLTNPGVSAYEKQQHEEASNTSFVYTNFLNVSHSLNSKGPEASLKDFQSIPSSSSLNFKNTGYQHDRKIQWRGFGENTSISWHKQRSENFLMGPQMLKERQNTLLDKSKRISPEWSEEELDFLWIGMRRYGPNNWNAILTDSKLCFLKSRVAEDLAEQWGKEQMKLLNGVLFEPTRPSRPHLSTSPFVTKPATNNHYGGNIILPTDSELRTFRAETKLSYGDLFLRSENNAKGNVPHFSGLTIAKPLVSKTPASPFLRSIPVRSAYPMERIRHLNNFKAHNGRYHFESPTSRQKSVETPNHGNQSPANSALAHWFNEILNTNQKRLGLPVPSLVQSMLNNKERTSSFLNSADPPAPPKVFHGCGVLKRKSVAFANNAGSTRVCGNAASMDELWLRKRLCLFPNVGLAFRNSTSVDEGLGATDELDLKKKSPVSIGPSNLVMIDDGTSSEETISDDLLRR